MITLKVTPYPDHSGLEATWLDQIKAPDKVIPDVPEVPAVLNEDGNEVSPLIPSIPESIQVGEVTETQVWCQSYHPTQMQMFRDKAAEFGTSLADYEGLISAIESTYIPPPPEPIQVPQVIEALQGLLALDRVGMSSYYETWANAPERTFAQKAFINKALTWKRDDPTLNTAASNLGLTSEQVDNLFLLASSL